MLHVYSAFPGEMAAFPISHFIVVGYKTNIFAVTHIISLVLLVALQRWARAGGIPVLVMGLCVPKLVWAGGCGDFRNFFVL